MREELGSGGSGKEGEEVWDVGRGGGTGKGVGRRGGKEGGIGREWRGVYLTDYTHGNKNTRLRQGEV